MQAFLVNRCNGGVAPNNGNFVSIQTKWQPAERLFIATAVIENK